MRLLKIPRRLSPELARGSPVSTKSPKVLVGLDNRPTK